MQTEIASGLRSGTRDYAIYLPLYNGTESLKIGVSAGQTFEPIAPRPEKPIVFYGTSSTHGASASRPGMPHPAMLVWWLQICGNALLRWSASFGLPILVCRLCWWKTARIQHPG